MKRIFLLILIPFFVFVHFSCSKDLNNRNVLQRISGKWNIKVDSFSVGAGATNHLQAYIGRESDYFIFNSNSILYIKEGSQYITSAYHVTSDSTMTVTNNSSGRNNDNNFLNNDSTFFNIRNLTDHTLTITAGFYLTPGGAFGRVVYLWR